MSHKCLYFTDKILPFQVLGSSCSVKCLDNSCSIHQEENTFEQEMKNYFSLQATSRMNLLLKGHSEILGGCCTSDMTVVEYL